MNWPELIVFDLDFTLWNCGETWCDCLTPPFRCHSDRIVDRTGRHIRLYDDVPAILDLIDERRCPMALASRTLEPVWADELIGHLRIRERFQFREIYPGSKLQHFEALRTAASVPFEGMLFFDDEMRNIRDVSDLGVTSIYVESGLTRELFTQAIAEFG